MIPNIKSPEVVQSILWIDDHIRIIDQTYLPHREFFLDIFEVGRVWEAIRTLRVRGAPAIGIAAAYGVYLGVKDLPEDSIQPFHTDVERICEYLATSRPTAVNLQWAMDKAIRTARDMKNEPVPDVKQALLELAVSIHEEDKRICADIGRMGQELIPVNAQILTHCNTGSLATGQYGTALSIIYQAHLGKKKIHVWVDETRPLLQGSRLTTWELEKTGVPHCLITDSMAAWVMKEKKVDMVVVGADRVTRNGDTANKIGTYGLAVLAKHHNIPFYVAVPLSSIDFNTESGDVIPIEERDADEVRTIGKQQAAPAETPVYNPAFDVTPNELISAFITEKGIIRPDFTKNLEAIRPRPD
ncbi:MAG: S-methyl-5-thioribose-1-phosphate isomerase [Cyclonatronaceae bacterium]